MDIIVLAKETLKSAEVPQVIYLGKSRSDARGVIDGAVGKFAWIYEVSSLPIRNYKTGKAAKPAAAVETVETASETSTPKRSKKSQQNQ